MTILQDSSILVTGGTGSFGKAFIRYALDNLGPRRIVIYSRDELKQYEARQMFADDPRLRWFIGDIRDQDRLRRAMHEVDYVVHAAALKQVDTAEYNPFEYVKTNIVGSQNVVEASIDAGVKKVVALSTDKASSPLNLYGATKLAADKLFQSANHYAASYVTRFSVVRYGNVMGSRGSVVPFFRKLAAEGKPLPITDSRMTRFWITLPQAVEFVVDSFDQMQGGELYVPRIPSMKITDLVEAIAPGAETYEIGIRPGEKLHEEMISLDDARRTLRLGDRFVVLPTIANWGFNPPQGEDLPDGFAYQSDSNDLWLDAQGIREILETLD
ncbi:UDP-N-acetylglucosamine 4,6-dehydratase (inverting) [Microbacterium sp. PI-1]|uniref:UDP-N-acetylglucosamine 4,6-dehydratase (Inverting) n=1 Tax=Microbacterium aurugineum TaxID=2851642 RepID=A0ABY4J7J3_9MICO|nr:UDP-N-acetylglucosamine 4,6-dehydratase (inverting) [Microbacterium sp. CBA3102]TCJ27964.1 UDP-N-acetylglucosamine 4,6-dehydratase (inverting) [Microbacterium sp. PI-1]UPL19553.1 UDP-N-acetylglucosamine 4,6-dehydratase (inverting) [Microbacterium aurugineum]